METEGAIAHTRVADGPADGGRWAAWIATALVLGGLFIAMRLLANLFAPESKDESALTLILVVLQITAGAVYLLCLFGLPRLRQHKAFLIFAIVVGLGFRLLMFGTHSMLETDAWRYLWDGGVVAAGHNPYQHAPLKFRTPVDEDVGPELTRLAVEGQEVVGRVNHAQLRTIYPPVAQAAFAIAHIVGPWSMDAWRLVMLLADGIALLFLLLIMRRLGLPLVLVVVYWWNPLLIKEVYNSGHMDILLLPFLFAGVWCIVHRKELPACGLLALAVGVKLWPVLLFPMWVRSLWDRKVMLILATLVFTIASAACLAPMLADRHDEDSGVKKYGATWEMNDGIFMVVHEPLKRALMDGVPEGDAHDVLRGDRKNLAGMIARVIVATILLAVVVWQIRKPVDDAEDVIRRCLIVTTVLFMVSPTQFPWYFLWLFPFLCLRPRFSLLLLTALMPLYNLRFYCKDIDRVALFDYWLVWLQYVPVWAFLLMEWRGWLRLRMPAAKEESHA
jgi:alpha-1,6-mannosyltransferase